MSDEFVMTYPCYFLLTPEGNPELVQVDDALCVCLFTDRHLLEEFHRHKYNGVGWQTMQVYAPKNAKELVEFLENGRETFESEGCRFVAIDVSAGKPPMYCVYGELVKTIRRE